jgi:hypothetical protein
MVNNDFGDATRKEKIKALKAYYKATNQQFDEWRRDGFVSNSLSQIPYPEICRDMKCEAKTRSGHPCKNDGTNWGNGRCKFHGGASTGPVSDIGKKRVPTNASKTKSMETT